MSFVAVFTASAMGFTILVPIMMVVVLLAYGAPARRAAAVEAEPTQAARLGGAGRVVVRHAERGQDRAPDVTRLAA